MLVASTGPAAKQVLDWDQFTGTRLFSWIGGLALFLGVAFLLKSSFEQGLISPIIRGTAAWTPPPRPLFFPAGSGRLSTLERKY